MADRNPSHPVPETPPGGLVPNAPLRPRDAATLILVDDTTARPKILMGRRRPDLVFMPNKYVFPGGRCEKSDRTPPAASELRDAELKKLLVDMKGTPSPARARALAMAAIRETYEETGVVVGHAGPAQSGDPGYATPDPAQNTEIAPAWTAFHAHGALPCLEQLRFFARAITPPGRPRRFDTRFFCTTIDAIAKQVTPPDDELHDIGWHDLDDVRNLDLPNITRAVVEDLCELIKIGLRDAGTPPVPYYYFKNGGFERDMITIETE
ncbi:MAG: NUDIX hydrolase [Pseudomonadota bacterium]